MDPYHQGNYGPPPPGYHPGGNAAGTQPTYMAAPITYMPPPLMPYHNGYSHMQLNQPSFPPMNNFQFQQPGLSMPPPHLPSYTPPSANFSSSITGSSGTAGSISAQGTTRPVGRTITLYIGSIPPGITDEHIESILRCCGTFEQWKRLKSSDGTPKKFGLADFTDPESLLRTWRVLKNPSQPIILPSSSEAEPVPLNLKLEDDIQLYLNQYKSTRTTDKTQDDETDEIARNKILEVIKAFSNSEKKDNASHRSGSSPRSESSYRYRRDREDHDDDDDDPAELAAMSRYKNQEEQRTRQRAVEYYDRLKQWEEREIYRAKAHDRNQIRDLELEERRAIDRKEHSLRFQEWDDDKERELGREDYYKDRARWWERRQVIRRRELEADEADRERLRQEIEAEEAKKRALEDQAKAHEFLLDPEIDEKRLGPGKVKFSLAPSGGSLLRGRPRPALGESAGNPDDDEEIEAAARKARRVLVPLEYSDSEDDKSRSYKSSRREISRNEQLRMLMDSIPSGRNELFNWEIKWSYLDESSLTKVRNFAGKKIVEYLGVEEPTLLNFILGILKSHSPPDVLVEELEKALDEEGATFVMKIWRMVIFETEAKAQNLR